MDCSLQYQATFNLFSGLVWLKLPSGPEYTFGTEYYQSDPTHFIRNATFCYNN